MNLREESLYNKTRREFLGTGGLGLGGIAMASMLSKQLGANTEIDPSHPQKPRDSHLDPKAKRVIYLHMTGSPPHLDLFDHKPELVKRDGEKCKRHDGDR